MNQQVKSFVFNIIPLLLIIIAGYFIVPVSLPIILAILTAYITDCIVQRAMTTFHISRKISVIILHTIFFAIMIAAIYFSITIGLKQMISLSKTLPDHFNTIYTLYISLQTKVFNWTNDWPIEVVEMLQISVHQQLTAIIVFLTQLVELERYSSIALATPDILLSFFVYFTVLYLVQIQLPTLTQQLLQPLKPDVSKKTILIARELKIAIVGFFKAQIMMSGIIAIIALPALYFILPKYALLLTIAITFIDAIPFLDSFFLLAPLALILFATGQTKLAIFILLLGILLMFVRRFLEPKLLGTQFNLPTLPTFVAMFIGLKLFGIIGLLVGPLVVIFIRSLHQQKLIRFKSVE